MFIDGGPDENPRFPKSIDVYYQHFKKYDLDALLVLTHAPGMPACNYVERKMAPLSKELAGLVIPHDSCGTHLDSQQRTIDNEVHTCRPLSTSCRSSNAMNSHAAEK